MAVGYGLMIMLDESSSLYVFISCLFLLALIFFFSAAQVIYPLIAGLGCGSMFQLCIVGLQAAMPLRDMATSTATMGMLRSLGSTIGVSVGQAVWSSVRFFTVTGKPPNPSAGIAPACPEYPRLRDSVGAACR